MSQKIPTVLQGAQPVFHRGNHTGCLIVHGFMASPAEVKWAGDHLAREHGYTVYVPRLSGHGIDPTHMPRMRWQDWYGDVLDGYHLLRQQCDAVYVVGHSMGGLLGLLLASQVAVDGLVVAASPLEMPTQLMRWARWISWLLPYTFHPSEDKLNEAILAGQAERDETPIGRVHYPKWSSRAIYELYRLILVTNEALPQVAAPLLLLYAKNDTTAAQSNIQRIQAAVASTVVEAVILEEGAHIMFQDVGRDAAFEAVATFIQARVNQTLTAS